MGRRRLTRKAKNPTRQPDGNSLINRLPREVLAEIFVQCLPEVGLWPRIEGRAISKNIAPLLLCNVCSPWRSLAHSIPTLWQTLLLQLTKAKQTKVDEFIALTHKWIERSGVLPLTLRLEACLSSGHAGDLGGFQTIITALLWGLSHYSSRWQHVDICILTCPPIIFPQLRHMPCLRSFSVNAKDFSGVQLPLSCPQLTGISWPFLCTISSAPSLPWHQLTRIAFGKAISSPEMLLILGSSPKLTDVQIALDDVPNEPLPCEMVVVSNTLRKLQLRVYHTCGPLLEMLTLPAVTDISIDFHCESAPPLRDVHKELLRFFSRSKCKLDRLELGDWSFDDAAFLKCLEHHACASLTKLGVLNSYPAPIFTDTVLVALMDSPEGKDNILLPDLAHLWLQMCFDGAPGILGMMIMSRCVLWDKDDQLQSLDLRFAQLDKRDFLYIRLAEEQGLKVKLTRGIEIYTL